MMNPPRFTHWLVSLIGFVALVSTTQVKAEADLSIYTDALVSDWQDWSWGITSNQANARPVHDGAASLAVTYTGGWQGLLLGYHGETLDVSAYDSLQFWIHGGATGGQPITFSLCYSSVKGDCLDQAVTPEANIWKRVEVPLAGLPSRTIYMLQWFNNSDQSQPRVYLDDIRLVASPKPDPVLRVDAAKRRHAISPDIYGINLATEAVASAVRLPVRRWGGNSTSRYNWKLDVHNTGSDWFFENIPEDNAHPERLPNGSVTDRFVAQDRRTGTRTLLTMPLMGWTPKARLADHPFDCGFQVSRYGAQDAVDPWDTNCGSGETNGRPLVGNDPRDTSQRIDTSFVTAWIKHLTGRFGTAGQGGVLFYALDNEPMLWDETHRDIHPKPTSYDELRRRTLDYAAAIKSADPTARTLGPVVWGWTAYFWSALDWAPGGAWWEHPQDRLAHGDVPFIEWYLQQMKRYEDEHGTRLLDYLDVHYYPQADGVSLTPAGQPGDAAVQTMRLRSTRALWDPTYRDESWIDQPVELIPRMKRWVRDHYPGTRLAITEYNWGALDDINGALAQADVLGIFGREGLDLATLWDAPTRVKAPGIFAFRLYRNYDGAGQGFGETSIGATSTDQDRLAIYAAQRDADQALTLVIINKTGQTLTSPIRLSGFQSGDAAQVYRYSAANLNAIVRRPDQPVTATGLTARFPAHSITLLVIPPAD